MLENYDWGMVHGLSKCTVNLLPWVGPCQSQQTKLTNVLRIQLQPHLSRRRYVLFVHSQSVVNPPLYTTATCATRPINAGRVPHSTATYIQIQPLFL